MDEGAGLSHFRENDSALPPFEDQRAVDPAEAEGV